MTWNIFSMKLTRVEDGEAEEFSQDSVSVVERQTSDWAWQSLNRPLCQTVGEGGVGEMMLANRRGWWWCNAMPCYRMNSDFASPRLYEPSPRYIITCYVRVSIHLCVCSSQTRHPTDGPKTRHAHRRRPGPLPCPAPSRPHRPIRRYARI